MREKAYEVRLGALLDVLCDMVGINLKDGIPKGKALVNMPRDPKGLRQDEFGVQWGRENRKM